MDISSITDANGIGLGKAARLARVDGRSPNQATVWRWCVKGVGPQKLRLPHRRNGKRIVTSPEAVAWFTEALANSYVDHFGGADQPAPVEPGDQRHRESEAQLEALAAAEGL